MHTKKNINKQHIPKEAVWSGSVLFVYYAKHFVNSSPITNIFIENWMLVYWELKEWSVQNFWTFTVSTDL